MIFHIALIILSLLNLLNLFILYRIYRHANHWFRAIRFGQIRSDSPDLPIGMRETLDSLKDISEQDKITIVSTVLNINAKLDTILDVLVYYDSLKNKERS